MHAVNQLAFDVVFANRLYNINTTCNGVETIIRIERGQQLAGMVTVNHEKKSINLVTAKQKDDFVKTTEHYDLYKGPGQFVSFFLTSVIPRVQLTV